MQSFLGKTNFVLIYVLGFSEIVRPLKNMIKKDVEFKWGELEKHAIYRIKESIAKAPLATLDFSRNFILYIFSYDLSYATVLMQKNLEGTSSLMHL